MTHYELLERNFIQTDDGPFAYVDMNSDANTTIVLIHGLGTNADAWSLQADALVRAGYRVIAPDLRGFGKSGIYEEITFENMVTDIILLMNQLGITQFHCVGLSMGGAVVQLLSLKHEDRVDSMTLLSTFPKYYTKSKLFFPTRLFLTRFVSMDVVAMTVSRSTFPHDFEEEYRERLKRHISMVRKSSYQSAIRQIQDFDVTEDIHVLQTPTLIVTGKNDQTVPLETQEILKQKMPHAKHIVMKGGHAPNVSYSEVFNAILLDFLAKQFEIEAQE